MAAVTAHSCGGPVFGRLTAGCPRCDELAAGAAPREQAWRREPASRGRWSSAARDTVRMHFTGERHRSGGCGPVCTYGDA